ncbi:D-alanyl-D-alanine carboxypeptidase family protein [Nocardia paucivorans]|uniref:D-alanyl-D-alanine carboxypeptidase family protein n=1 Tax=Nocardia paucivorans TaxID=114259 RepID=UPI00030DBED2|nr:D-alanyl-D-alanine carboxypeptidase family protein [Nocardia paucivorans]
MNVWELHRRTARRIWPVLTATALAVGPIALCGPAAGQPPPMPTPFVTPATDHCPYKTQPRPPIDLSEVPRPGEPSPAPLPVPNRTVGGEKLAACGVVLPEGAPPPPADISATAWMVSDLDTGAVLAAKDPHGRYRPASTIKILLATVALRNLDLDKVVVGTQADADMEGTRVGIGPGGRYTNRQLLQALLMTSGNDAAHAIAAQFGGDEAAVAKMNDLAKSLRAFDTRAATPSGLDGPGMSTSAYDLSLLFREAMAIPLFAEIIGTEQVDFPGYPPNPAIPGDTDHPGFPIGNDNQLLYNYPGALGGKTGFTDDARQTFVAGAERNGRRLAVTLLQADVLPIRPWEQAARLLDYGFALDPALSVGQLPDDEPKPESEVTVLAAPPGEGVGNLAQAPSGNDHEQWRILAMIAALVLIPTGLLWTWHIRTRR